VRKSITIIYFILSLYKIVQAQNLVPNGDFEIHDTCPSNYSQISRAIGWKSALQTPDYYNSCATYSDLLVPYNQRGYQQDYHNGQGYSGIAVFDNDASNGYARECMQIKLTDTLKHNKRYIASMYASRSNNLDYAIASIGILFTDTAINLGTTQGIIYANPQINNGVLLSDTLNWMLIQDTFIVSGNETYLTIGNFNTTATSDTVNTYGNWNSLVNGAYYYIDGVSVYEIDGTCNNLWDAGFTKYILAGDSIRLGAINTDNSTYAWVNSVGANTCLSSNASANPWAKPTQTTTYYVTKTCPNKNVFKDTVTVYVQQNVGIKQYAGNDEQISLYPNPNNGNMTFEYNIKEDAVLEISDLNGRLVGTYNLPALNSKMVVKGEGLINAIYMYRVTSNGAVIKIGKIVVMQ
jgi:hypothetical protein